MLSRIEPMKKVERMLRTHRDLILNYFKVRKMFSGGIIEGLNNKANSFGGRRAPSGRRTSCAAWRACRSFFPSDQIDRRSRKRLYSVNP